MDEFKNMEGARFGAGAADEAEELLGSKMELDSHNVTSSSDWEGESDRESEFSSYESDLFASEEQLSETSPCHNGMCRLVSYSFVCQTSNAF